MKIISILILIALIAGCSSTQKGNNEYNVIDPLTETSAITKALDAIGVSKEEVTNITSEEKSNGEDLIEVTYHYNGLLVTALMNKETNQIIDFKQESLPDKTFGDITIEEGKAIDVVMAFAKLRPGEVSDVTVTTKEAETGLVYEVSFISREKELSYEVDGEIFVIINEEKQYDLDLLEHPAVKIAMEKNNLKNYHLLYLSLDTIINNDRELFEVRLETSNERFVTYIEKDGTIVHDLVKDQNNNGSEDQK